MDIFDSPESMRGAVGKEVIITTLNGITHRGFLYTIDPMTKTVVLTDDAGDKLNLILHHAIKNLECGQRSVERFILACPSKEVLLSSGSEEKKQKLMKLLKDNLIEVVEDGPLLRISDYVSIAPPYDVGHIYCTNTIVLERLSNIIKRMPA